QEGLEPGEEIVSSGTFTVDAAIQLSGRPSMMNPGITNEDNPSAETHRNTVEVEISEARKKELNEVINAYLQLKNALVADDFSRAQKEAKALQLSLEQVEGSALNSGAEEVWEKYEKELEKDASQISGASNISEMRNRFDALS